MRKQKHSIIQHKPTLKEFELITDDTHLIFDKGYFNSNICIVINQNTITPFNLTDLCTYLLQFDSISISTNVKDAYVIELSNEFIIFNNEKR